MLSCSANQMRIILVLAQSGVSNFALIRKKIKKKCPLSQQSAISNFALMYSACCLDCVWCILGMIKILIVFLQRTVPQKEDHAAFAEELSTLRQVI